MISLSPTVLNNSLFGLKYNVQESHLSLSPGGNIVLDTFGERNLSSPLESFIFGYRIPHLINFAEDSAFQASTREDAIQNILTHWIKSLHTIWYYSCGAFSFRLYWDPHNGTIEIGLLCRITNTAPRLGEFCDRAAKTIKSLMGNLHLPCEPLKTAKDFVPFLGLESNYYIEEIRQKEDLLTIELPGNDFGQGYAIYPFTTPRGDWIDFFRALTTQSSPILVNLHLQPTILLQGEDSRIAQAAQTSKDLADFIFEGYNTHRIKDHHASICYRLYSVLAQRLEKPFLVTAQIMGKDKAAVNAISHRLGAAIIVPPIVSAEAQEQELKSAFQTYATDDQQTHRNALTTLHHLWLTDWGETNATKGFERLRYLVDARGAATLFRLPIPSETGLPGVEVRKKEQAYETGKKASNTPKDYVLFGHLDNGGIQSISVKDFSRHGLICGIPGSGKTNTTLSILSQLWRDHKIPFWVFEPPKTEYRGLMNLPGFEDLLVFTVGDESTAPLRLNPFELLPGISVETHSKNLKDCFEAGLARLDEKGQLLPLLLAKATNKIYKRKGWKFYDKGTPNRELPTLNDLLITAKAQLNDYAGENSQNLKAAIGNRIEGLLRGSNGRMFNTERGIAVSELFSRPVIFELSSMGSDAPLVIMFLLTILREHAQKRIHGDLQHVTVIEEAHTIMTRSFESDAGNAASGAANAFENILAELRSAGEGIIIAEQSPTKLIKGAIDLTNFKMVHRLSGPEEVKAVGGAMIATAQQCDSMQRLPVGKAALFMEGLHGLTFIQVPNFKDDNDFKERLQDEAVAKHMKRFYQDHPEYKLPFTGCSLCRGQCQFRWDIEPVALDEQLRSQYESAAKNKSEKKNDQAFRDFYNILLCGAHKAGLLEQPESAWCYCVQMNDLIDEDYILNKAHRQEFNKWMKIIYR